MTEDSSVTLDTKKLDALIKAFSGNLPSVRIGILQDNTHAGSKSTNAEIGAAHEYGAPAKGLPMRSFLRVPLGDHLNEYMEKAGLYKSDVIEKFAVQDGSMLSYMRLVGEVALNVVRDGFQTRGFGKWPKWKDPQYQNNAGQVLVDTGQLRDSITYEVK